MDDFWERLHAAHPRRPGAEDHRCPRRDDAFLPPIGETSATPDCWGPDDACSYCGSLDPDVFMARLEANTLELGPTDKSYKVYLKPINGGPKLKQCFRGEGDPGGSDPTRWVWTTRETDWGKFYFQHLSEAQKRRFIELMNGKLTIGYPGHFYRLPFFIQRVTVPAAGRSAT